MTIWIDAQLSPSLAVWMTANFPLMALALRDLGLRDAADHQIFTAAQQDGVVVMTKDRDFVELLKQFGPPPQVIWLTCGNTSNAYLKQVLSAQLSSAIALLNNGEPLVTIR